MFKAKSGLEPISNYKAEFIKEFNRLGWMKSGHDRFMDFLTLAFSAIAKTTERGEEAERLEAEYMAVVKRYSRDEKELEFIRESAPKLLAITQLALSEKGTGDFLGEIFHELELHNKNLGQFFTPFSLSLMMAKMNLTTMIDELKAGKRKFFTMSEPACGAGGMILAAAQALEDEGLDPAKVLFFEATDLSDMAFKMCYVQTALRGLAGFVLHGNSLSLEIFHKHITPGGIMFFGFNGNPYKSTPKGSIRDRSRPAKIRERKNPKNK